MILAGAGILAGLFGLVKYMIGQNTKREQAILDHHEKQQTQMLAFYENKNGHLERVSKMFAESNDKMGITLSKLTTQIQVLADRHR